MKLFFKGPVMAYMKKVTDSTTDVGYGSGWFKISEAGLNVASKTSIMATPAYY
jgi:cellulase